MMLMTLRQSYLLYLKSCRFTYINRELLVIISKHFHKQHRNTPKFPSTLILNQKFTVLGYLEKLRAQLPTDFINNCNSSTLQRNTFTVCHFSASSELQTYKTFYINSFHAISSSEPKSNRLLLVRVWYCSDSLLWNKFGLDLVRLYFEEHDSGSILFEFILKNMIRVRFCSNLFSWKRIRVPFVFGLRSSYISRLEHTKIQYYTFSK